MGKEGGTRQKIKSSATEKKFRRRKPTETFAWSIVNQVHNAQNLQRGDRSEVVGAFRKEKANQAIHILVGLHG